MVIVETIILLARRGTRQSLVEPDQGESLFPEWGMLPACRTNQLSVYRKLEAYAT